MLRKTRKESMISKLLLAKDASKKSPLIAVLLHLDKKNAVNLSTRKSHDWLSLRLLMCLDHGTAGKQIVDSAA